MAHSIGNGEIITGSHVISTNGALGINGEDIPSTGGNGAAYAYPSLVLPADNTVEIRGTITVDAAVTAGVGTITSFTVNEDTSYTLVVTDDCTVEWTWDLYRDGVLDTAGLTGTITVGAGTTFNTLMMSTNF